MTIQLLYLYLNLCFLGYHFAFSGTNYRHSLSSASTDGCGKRVFDLIVSFQKCSIYEYKTSLQDVTGTGPIMAQPISSAEADK